MGHRVVSSAALPAPMSEILGSEFTYVAPAKGNMGRADLEEHISHAHGFISLLTVAVDEALLQLAPKLRVIANFAVGYDNIDIEAASRRGILVCNTPDVLTDTTADMAFGLLLACARRIVEGDAWVRSGEWPGWAPAQHLGATVTGQTLGIVGLGRIGQAMARRAAGFGMTVLYSGYEKEEAEDLGAIRVSKDELLERSDFVSLHCPLSEHTRHYIDADALRKMPPHAILINTARGGCVDESALADAIARGEIAGAGLDVYEEEPRVHAALRAETNVVLAPHAASATTRTRRRMGELCALGVREVLLGGVPSNVVNPEARGRRG